MTRNQRYLVILALLVPIAVGLWRYFAPAPSRMPSATKANEITQGSSNTSSAVTSGAQARQRSDLEQAAYRLGVSTQRLQQIRLRIEKLQDDPDWDSKQPMLFYGKVVDQDELPVAEANVRFDWANARGEGASASALSDVQGLFSLSGVLGKRLQVRVEKKGYYSSKRRNRISFEYADPGEAIFHTPDPINPVLFFLRKVGTGNELITSESGLRRKLALLSPTNGEPIRVDFFTLKDGATGQLQIQGWKAPKDLVSGRNNWGFRLSVLDGGLVEHDDEFPFEAAEEGYQPMIEWHFKSDGDWQPELVKHFYVKFSTPPKFAWITIDTSAFDAVTFLEYAVNPSGSRNLEPILKSQEK